MDNAYVCGMPFKINDFDMYIWRIEIHMNTIDNLSPMKFVMY